MADARRAPGTPSQFADRRGGPGNFGGTNYQVQTQVRLTLQWLADFRRNPAATAQISCEPRHLMPSGQLGFDIALLGTTRPGTDEVVDELTEVKLRPTQDEVLDLVARARLLVETRPARPTAIGLVAAEMTRAFTALERLCLFAREAGGDAGKFSDLVEHADRADLRELYDALGDDPCAAAALLARPECRDRISTTEMVRFMAKSLAEPGHVDTLVETLAAQFHTGAETRRTFPGAELARYLEDRGLLTTAPVVDYSDVPDKLLQALVVLRLCDAPLPVDVLAEGLGISRDNLDELFADHEQLRIVVREDNAFWLSRRDNPYPPEYARTELVRTLQILNRLADQQQAAMAEQTLNAVALARACAAFDLRTVAFTFKAFDKASKAWGDLWTVYELAQISNDVLLELLNTDLAEGEASQYAAWRAQTYICGQGWVLQRVDDLPQAMSYMERAREISASHQDEENEAFAFKCEGRIRRMQAEVLDVDDPERGRLLEESARLLRESKPLFDNLLRGNPRFVENRGECVSLLARTIATTGDLKAGKLLVAEAHRLLDSVPSSKAYADLVILEAEIVALEVDDRLPGGGVTSGSARNAGGVGDAGAGETGAALTEQVDNLNALIDQHDTPKKKFERASNEITARARVVLGSILELAGDTEGARRTYLDAVAQYERLRCHIGRRDEAAWMARVLTQPPVPDALVSLFDTAGATGGARLRATERYFELWTPADPSSRMNGSAHAPDLDALHGLVTQAINQHTASLPRWGEGRASA